MRNCPGRARALPPTVLKQRQAAIVQLLSTRQIRDLWKRAKDYVLRVLRLRKKFARLGQHLQQKRIREIAGDLVRVKGVLKRVTGS
jgi:hypothetical protein